MSSTVGLVNKARSNPERTGLDIHSKLKDKFRGTELEYFNKRIDTFEGGKVLDDLYSYLKHLSPTRELIESPALTRVAEMIASEKGKKGETTHERPKAIHEKVEKICRVEGKVGELMCFGTNSHQETFFYFMMDDGLASRKRRRMLLDPEYRYIGAGNAYHSVYGTITVILLAESIVQ